MKPTGRLATLITKSAAKLKGATEGVACAGTAIEATTWAVGKDVFVFAGVSKGIVSVRLKLKQPAPGITLGKTGWATVKFGEGEAPPKALAGWIVESHRIVTRGSFDAGVRSTR